MQLIGLFVFIPNHVRVVTHSPGLYPDRNFMSFWLKTSKFQTQKIVLLMFRIKFYTKNKDKK